MYPEHFPYILAPDLVIHNLANLPPFAAELAIFGSPHATEPSPSPWRILCGKNDKCIHCSFLGFTAILMQQQFAACFFLRYDCTLYDCTLSLLGVFPTRSRHPESGS